MLSSNEDYYTDDWTKGKNFFKKFSDLVIGDVLVTRKTKRNAAKVNATLRFILQIFFKTVAVTFARRRF